jgi:WD40 repeat protein
VAVGIHGHAVIAPYFALAGKRDMRLFPAVAVALVLAQPGNPLFCETPSGFPSPPYVLHIPGLLVAEMSPEEEHLIALVMRWPKGDPPTAELQVWDFRKGMLLQTHSLPTPETSSPALQSEWQLGITALRYTSDGQLLVVSMSRGLVHVLRTDDLEEIRTIHVPSHAKIHTFEVSPAAHQVAVRVSDDILLYDLDSGGEIRRWKIKHSDGYEQGLAWRSDGGALAASVADYSPCNRGGGMIYVFDPRSEKISNVFDVPLLPADIAFGPGDTLYVASNTCGGYFAHWALDLPFFDSATGKKMGRIPAGRVGFRTHIAIPANKHVLLAHADREKTTFEGLEDTLKVTDAQWQVWDLSSGKVVLTMPETIETAMDRAPSLSNNGHFVYARQEQGLQIFSVPTAEK